MVRIRGLCPTTTESNVTGGLSITPIPACRNRDASEIQAGFRVQCARIAYGCRKTGSTKKRLPDSRQPAVQEPPDSRRPRVFVRNSAPSGFGYNL
jgi:hypothetical protein